MFQSFLIPSAVSVISAALGGFGVFCVVYSVSSPYLAVQGLILLGAALAIVCFTNR
jgi:hypothetical protein